MKKKTHYINEIVTAIFVICMISCPKPLGDALEHSKELPPIFPDYTSVTIPPNIAPLNFQVDEDISGIKAEVYDRAGTQLMVVCGKKYIDFPQKEWKQLLRKYTGESLNFRVSVWSKQHPQGIVYAPFSMDIAMDEIDPWLVYRLVDPAYVNWCEMGIYTRDITGFKEKALVTNHEEKNQCMNCHTPYMNSPSTYFYHVRVIDGGTAIVRNNQLKMVQLNELGKKQQGAYSAWHPSGKYIAFTSNAARQSFLYSGNKAIEGYDVESDLFIYDVENNQVVTDDRFNGPENWETFPTWSGDGKYIYFCTTKAEPNMPDLYQQVKYALIKVPFDETNGTLGAAIDTIYQPSIRGGSVSQPRISYDGRFLLYTEAACSTTPVFHAEADLRLMDLKSGKELDTRMINSNESESYHAWSSNGRWILFASRRMDGRHARPFFAYVSPGGKLSKPFMLPQRNPEEHRLRMQAYNCPEFVTGEIIAPNY